MNRKVEPSLEIELTGLGSTDPGCISSVKYFIVLKASRIAGFNFPRLFTFISWFLYIFSCFLFGQGVYLYKRSCKKIKNLESNLLNELLVQNI